MSFIKRQEDCQKKKSWRNIFCLEELKGHNKMYKTRKHIRRLLEERKIHGQFKIKPNRMFRVIQDLILGKNYNL